MRKKYILSLIFVFLIFLNVLKTNVFSSEYGLAVRGYNGNTDTDYRVVKLRNYLVRFNSPLSEYSEFMIRQADYYGMDWRLVPAISGTESTFGLHIPYNSYNAYGWDNGTYKFNSWYDSISHVTKSLHKLYISRGAVTIDQIAPIYNPVTPDAWRGHVNYFINAIENTPPLISEVLHIQLAI